jgi:hypothetical protein
LRGVSRREACQCGARGAGTYNVSDRVALVLPPRAQHGNWSARGRDGDRPLTRERVHGGGYIGEVPPVRHPLFPSLSTLSRHPNCGAPVRCALCAGGLCVSAYVRWCVATLIRLEYHAVGVPVPDPPPQTRLPTPPSAAYGHIVELLETTKFWSATTPRPGGGARASEGGTGGASSSSSWSQSTSWSDHSGR